MNLFSKDSGCPKCGTTMLAKTEYHAALMANEVNCETGERGEHMHRTCHECGYNWAEAPLTSD